MVLAIISFVLEIIMLLVAKAMIDAGTLAKGFAIMVIFVMVLCTLTSIGCIIYNAKNVKEYYISKGISITGLVFSIVGTILGLIFCISCIAGAFYAAAQ